MIVTHKTKGGTYKYLGKAKGAGALRNEVKEVYQCTETGQLYYRDPVDFKRQMELKQ